MSKQHHYLKTVSPFFMDIYDEKKTFEVRRNDRNFQIGDVLHLQEFIPPETYTGREIRADITYILDDERFCKEGYVVMGIDVYAANFITESAAKSALEQEEQK